LGEEVALKYEPIKHRSLVVTGWIAWARRDFKASLAELDAGKLMGGFLIFPVCLGIAYEIGKALGMAN
jgi:hypothetical protein